VNALPCSNTSVGLTIIERSGGDCLENVISVDPFESECVGAIPCLWELEWEVNSGLCPVSGSVVYRVSGSGTLPGTLPSGSAVTIPLDEVSAATPASGTIGPSLDCGGAAEMKITVSPNCPEQGSGENCTAENALSISSTASVSCSACDFQEPCPDPE
jgi:hypothetical protein